MKLLIVLLAVVLVQVTHSEKQVSDRNLPAQSDITKTLLQFEERIQNLEQKNHQLELVNHQFEERVRKLELQNHDLEFVNNELKNDIAFMKLFNESTITKNQEQNPYVAFTAYSGDTREYMAGGIVQFELIVNNYGEHYSPIVSAFTCPFDGYYLFSVSVVTTAGNKADLELMLDDIMQVGAVVREPNGNTQATTVFVTLCNAGQVVHVRNTEDNSVVFGSGGRHTTFTGALIQAVSEGS